MNSEIFTIFAVTLLFLPTVSSNEVKGVDVLVIFMQNYNGSEFNTSKMAFVSFLSDHVFDFGNHGDDSKSRFGYCCSDKLSKAGSVGGYVGMLSSKNAFPKDGIFCKRMGGSDSLDDALTGADKQVTDSRSNASLITIVVVAKHVAIEDVASSGKRFRAKPNMLLLVYLLGKAEADSYNNAVNATGMNSRVMNFKDISVESFRTVLCEPESYSVDPTVPCLPDSGGACVRTQIGIPTVLRPDVVCPEIFRTKLIGNCNCLSTSSSSEQIAAQTSAIEISPTQTAVKIEKSGSTTNMQQSNTKSIGIGTDSQTVTIIIVTLSAVVVLLVVVNVVVMLFVIRRRRRRNGQRSVDSKSLSVQEISKKSTKSPKTPKTVCPKTLSTQGKRKPKENPSRKSFQIISSINTGSKSPSKAASFRVSKKSQMGRLRKAAPLLKKAGSGMAKKLSRPKKLSDDVLHVAQASTLIMPQYKSSIRK